MFLLSQIQFSVTIQIFMPQMSVLSCLEIQCYRTSGIRHIPPEEPFTTEIQEEWRVRGGEGTGTPNPWRRESREGIDVQP